jgi:antitoxin component of RelBE/YafQ-DinJ toxin-antitoxin module
MMRKKDNSIQWHLQVNPELDRRARETADRLGISLSDLIRVVMDRGTHDVGGF